VIRRTSRGTFDCQAVARLIDLDKAASPRNAGRVLAAIADRLERFTPAINLNRHIDGDLEVCAQAGEGIYFKPVNAAALKSLFKDATYGGQTAFADPNGRDRDNWPLCLSMGATHGEGFREIRGWATPAFSDPIGVPATGASYEKVQLLQFSAVLGDDPAFDLHSLHVAVASDVVNIHVDSTGFMLRGFDGMPFMTPDFGHHTGNELVWKTYVKKALPEYLGFITDHVSFNWANAANGYQTRGPSLRQIGRTVERALPRSVIDAGGALAPRLGAAGAVLGKVWDVPVLPGGMTVDLLRRGHTRLDVTLTWNDGSSVAGGARLSGRW
jgi:hypothetical protein